MEVSINCRVGRKNHSIIFRLKFLSGQRAVRVLATAAMSASIVVHQRSHMGVEGIGALLVSINDRVEGARELA